MLTYVGDLGRNGIYDEYKRRGRQVFAGKEGSQRVRQQTNSPWACITYIPTTCLPVFLTRRPWISPLERSHCAAKLNLPLTAMVEGIGDDPALADTSGDPDAMTSALLPAVDSRYDLQECFVFGMRLSFFFIPCVFFLGGGFACGMGGVVGMHARMRWA